MLWLGMPDIVPERLPDDANQPAVSGEKPPALTGMQGSDSKGTLLHLLQVKDASGGAGAVRLTNPMGVQLVTQTHVHRAPDKRFGEPEELLKDR